MVHRQTRRRVLAGLSLVAAGAALLSACASGPSATNTVVFNAYTASGALLSWSQFRNWESNGHGSVGYNDALLDPSTLAVTSLEPLHSTGRGSAALELPPGPATLSMAWPTAQGDSMLLVDLPRPGAYNLDLLAARQQLAGLDTYMSARALPATALSEAAHRLYARASIATGTEQGALAAQALDATVAAETDTWAAFGRASPYPGLQRAVTLDTIAGAAGKLSEIARLFPGGWVRIVFDSGAQPSDYRAEIDQAHAVGLHVLGELVDSSAMKGFTVAAFQSRARAYVGGLPAVDEWEVGNEVNGDWLGTDVVTKVSYAAAYVKAHSAARTLVTLYWQMGEGSVANSMFTWARANLPAFATNVDDIGISLYPAGAPMGAALDRVMVTLHASFPHQRIGITELGIGEADTGGPWWWGSPTDSAAAQTSVIHLYQPAIMGYPYALGGAYWWYFAEEGAPGGTVWNALASS